MKTTLREVKQHNPEWFTDENKRFFHDVDYCVMYGEMFDIPYLVRSTYAWSDMFGQKAKLHFRINEIGEHLEVGNLTDDIFNDMSDVEDWLTSH